MNSSGKGEGGMAMTNKRDLFHTRCISSLEKVFADEELDSVPFHHATALWNESYSFQVAYRNEGEIFKDFTVEIASDLEEVISVQSIGLVPSEFPMYKDHDAYVLRNTPGLYPDPLYPIEEVELVALPDQWRSVWVSVDLHEATQAGMHDITVKFVQGNGEVLGEEKFTLDVIPVTLPKQAFIHTEWFHADCIAVAYDVEVFSQAHWDLLEKYIKTATRHGINMIYTPLFTPPLDTVVGGERATVQLVDVEKLGDTYRFDFTKLKKWLDMCRRCGVEYFEFSHLFTQWGAKHAPKIIGREKDEDKQLFGWETEAAGREYRDFLDQFLPQLVEFIDEEGIRNQAYFHVSDEPTLGNIDSYQEASAIVQEHLRDFPVMDALSDYDFYEKGYVKNPIVANDHIDVFIENNVADLWAYYCCAQYKDVSNRFFTFPSARNRVLGYQLFKYDIKGFLQWGYNFWFTQFSRQALNPFENTDAGCGFPSGDAFLVYPGETGPIESIRLKVLYEAMQDLRALQLLMEKIGKEAVLALLEENLVEPLSFTTYPHDAAWLLQKRAAITERIRKEMVD